MIGRVFYQICCPREPILMAFSASKTWAIIAGIETQESNQAGIRPKRIESSE